MRNRQHRPTARSRSYVKLVLSLSLLGAAILFTIGVVEASQGQLAVLTQTPGKIGAGGGSPISGQKGSAMCDEPGQPACPSGPNTWVLVKSLATADVLAALKSCPDYMSPVDAAEVSSSSYGFDAPVLVKPATTGAQADSKRLSHLMIRASIDGIRRVTYDILYDAVSQQLRISSVGIQDPNDPHYNKPFPWVGLSANAAVAQLATSRQISASTSVKPELVYFSALPSIPGKPITWTGGGTDPAVPIWRLKGNDGHTYFVGVDGRVYGASELPVAQGSTVIQL